MIRLYIPLPFASQGRLPLPPEASHYLTNVMRQKTGDTLLVFNGEAGEWRARIGEAHKKHTTLELLEPSRPFAPLPRRFLLFSPLKPKPMEFILEKGTELGVTDFMPTLMRHSSIHKINEEKMQRHAIEASEQSGRLEVPTIHPLEKLEDRLKNWPQDIPLFIGDETHSSPLLEKTRGLKSAGFMVGPEGGFHTSEFTLFKEFSFIKPVDLGPTILRAETAALAGLVLIR